MKHKKEDEDSGFIHNQFPGFLLSIIYGILSDPNQSEPFRAMYVQKGPILTHTNVYGQGL